MKKIKGLCITILFVAIVLFSIVSLSYMLRPVDGENEDIRNRITGFYAEPDNSLDVVVLGSSAVYRYINNPLLWQEEGITSYNFATPGLSIFLLEYLLEEADKTQSPEVYIIDARKFLLTEGDGFKKNRFQQIVNNMKYSSTRVKMINRMIENPIERVYYYFDFMIYHDQWEYLTKESLDYADNEKDSITKGFENVRKINPISPVDVSEITEKEPLSNVAENTLISLLDKCKEMDVQVLFLQTPWKVDEKNQKQSNYMKDIVESYGFEYLDLNCYLDDLNIDFSVDFYNTRHVNQSGAKKVTLKLGEYLTQSYTFDQKKTEEVVEAWNWSNDYLQGNQ